MTGAGGETAGMRIRHPRPASDARSTFAGFRFPSDVIVLAVRWDLRFGLSYRDLEELLAERAVGVDHVTVYRWVVRFAPLLAEAARPCRHAVGNCWQVDETYVKVAGQWRYVYRAIDQFGQGHCCIEPEGVGGAQRNGGFPHPKAAKKGSNYSIVAMSC